MWWKLRRHRLAVLSGVILLLLYFAAAIAEIIAPYDLHTRHTDYLFAPPQSVHLFHEGRFVGPFVYGMDVALDLDNMRWDYSEDRARIQPLRFFCAANDYPGARYRFWDLVEGRSTSSVPRQADSSSCWAPTGSAATCCRASSTARASRSPSG